MKPEAQSGSVIHPGHLDSTYWCRDVNSYLFSSWAHILMIKTGLPFEVVFLLNHIGSKSTWMDPRCTCLVINSIDAMQELREGMCPREKHGLNSTLCRVCRGEGVSGKKPKGWGFPKIEIISKLDMCWGMGHSEAVPLCVEGRCAGLGLCLWCVSSGDEGEGRGLRRSMTTQTPALTQRTPPRGFPLQLPRWEGSL